MTLGLGAMLHQLGGGSKESSEKYHGRTIEAASFDYDKLHLTFTDGVSIIISDEGQSCCEHRYMRTDDDVKDLVGGKLVHITLKDAPDVEQDYEVHEIQFMEVMTDKGCVTFSSHNEHNGYYGGICMSISEESNE